MLFRYFGQGELIQGRTKAIDTRFIFLDNGTVFGRKEVGEDLNALERYALVGIEGVTVVLMETGLALTGKVGYRGVEESKVVNGVKV